MKTITINAAIFLMCILTITAYNPCSVIQFSDYSFDLTGLSSNYTIVYNNTYYAKITPCYITACDQNTTSQKSFILTGGGGQCQPYTINATIFQNFNYINPQSQKDGISITYLPYIDTKYDGNNLTQTIYSAQFNIYCSTTTSVQQNCVNTTGSANTTTLANGTTITTIKKSLVCSKPLSLGCPTLTLNNYWQFLSNNSIWFAIVLWIFSVFELLFGYFVIRLTIFLYGILTGAVFGIIFSAQSYVNFFYDSTGSGIIIFIILLSFLMGVLFGFSLLTLPRLGYMNIGMWDAIIFSLLLQNSVLYLSGSMTGFYITLGVTCLLMFAISLLRFRKFIILSTPFISAFWIIRTLGFFLPYYPNEFASEKLFAINSTTPWQFYLYLVSIIVLSILGCTFQFCWYKSKGRDHRNKGYYLEDDDDVKQKLKKFLQFKDIKNLINAGKEEVQFLKKIMVDRDESSEEAEPIKEKKQEIQLVKMSKLKPSKQKPKKNNESAVKRSS